jgi:DNA-binding GntR family transcriptional regulator
LEGAGNPELTAMLRLLHARIDLLRRYSLSAERRHEKSLAEIRAICRAIIAGDGEQARIAGGYHVAQARAAALPRVFQQQYETNRATANVTTSE